MATQLATIPAGQEAAPLPVPMKWMPLSSVFSLLRLTDRNAMQRPNELMCVRRVMERDGVDPAAALAECFRTLTPCPSAILAKRIASLWKSTTPTGAMTSGAYLIETGRLLNHLPHDILFAAIDDVLRANVKGFTPPAAAILAIAEPKLAERKRLRAGLAMLVEGEGNPLFEDERRGRATEIAYCTPEQAREIYAKRGFDIDAGEEKPKVPRGPGRKPTREDYIRLGVDPAVLDAMDQPAAPAEETA